MELKVLIVSKLAAQKLGVHNLKALRLVSKSWRDAVMQCQATITVGPVGRSNKLGHLCAIFPNMEHLSIFGVDTTTKLDILSTLGRLTEISLYFNRSDAASQPSFKISLLPPSLRQLTIFDAQRVPEQLDKTTLPHLTKLHLWEEADCKAEAWDLCSKLTQLKDLNIGHPPLREFPLQEAFEGRLISMSALTRLTLSWGQLCKPPKTWQVPFQLKELYLNAAVLNEIGLNALGKKLSDLTYLGISCCQMERTESTSTNISLEAMTSLRLLELEASSASLVGLAGSGLQQLRFARTQKLLCQALSKVTGLTKLVLFEVKGPQPAFPAEGLRQLRQLVIMDCPEVESAIFVPGSLVSLEQLHIERRMECPADSEDEEEMVLPSQPFRKQAEELSRAGDVIMGLSKLRQISGGCYLLRGILQERLSAWHFSKVSCGDLGIPYKVKTSRVKTWTKA